MCNQRKSFKSSYLTQLWYTIVCTHTFAILEKKKIIIFHGDVFFVSFYY